jgi:GNAT superfamily N-acetyltransferase
MALEVIEVSSPREMHVFNVFPGHIYRAQHRAPSFPVLELSRLQEDFLFARVQAQPFLAVKDSRAVGRVAAAVHGALLQDKTGFFGYFETINEPGVAAALLSRAADWLGKRGVKKMIGPVDLSPHERLGLLVKGFTGYHNPGMPYNPPYYQALLEQCGLSAEIDLFAYHHDLRSPWPKKLVRVAERCAGKPQLKLRSFNPGDLQGEGEILAAIHNGSMDVIWGFTDLSPAEGTAVWKKLKGYFDPRLALIAEMNGQPAGLCLALRPAGRRTFSGLPGQLNARLAVLAVLPRYRLQGLEALLILECFRRARNLGFITIEFSLIAENNVMMNRIIERLGAVDRSRVYRIYKTMIMA